MADIITLVHFVVVSVFIGQILIHGFVNGRTITSTGDKIINRNLVVKTIESEDNELIDCIDIYKQPAFDHPSLRNHIIQMRPSWYPNGIKTTKFKFELSQNWHKNGKCPDRTIPIRRNWKNDVVTSTFLASHGRKYHRKSKNSTMFEFDPPSHHEHAVVSVSGDKYYGAEAGINIWEPKLGSPSEFSLSQIWVLAGEESNLNTIEAGWTVNPLLYGDNKTRLFIYWTSDNYRSTGCYNLLCPGFVQTNKHMSIGSVIKTVSTYNGKQFDLFLSIFKEKNTGNWWLQLQGNPLGYWPNSIFTKLSKASDTIEWGGEIVNIKSGGRHTRTEMGSGYFPSNGYKKSSYFRNLRIVDGTNTLKGPKGLIPFATDASCYDLEIEEQKKTKYGSFFYYGGHGFSRDCP